MPSQFSFFEPTISYATVSYHVVRKILTSNESTSLKESLLQASETIARMDKTKRDEFESLVQALSGRVTELKRIFERVSDYLSNQTSENELLQNETKFKSSIKISELTSVTGHDIS